MGRPAVSLRTCRTATCRAATRAGGVATAARTAFPAERLLGAWLLFAALSTVLLGPPHALAITLVTAVSGGALLALSRLEPRGVPALDRVRALLPLALFAPFYTLSGRINIGLDRWILDGPLERAEAAIFGGQPSMSLASAMPWPLLSEALHACYFAYFLLVPMPAILLALQGRDREQVRVVAWITGCFLFCQIFYVWLPATSPLYAYPPLPPPLDQGVFYGLTHAAARAGGVVGGAFPSSHAALGSLALLLAWRYERRWFAVALLPTLGMLLATVYGRWHYALDTSAGIGIAIAFAALERRRSARLGAMEDRGR